MLDPLHLGDELGELDQLLARAATGEHRFVAPGKVVLAREDNPNVENYAPLQAAHEYLKGEREARGRRLEVIPLPMPSPRLFDGQRLPAGYAKFLIVNGRVLVPTFNDPKDQAALEQAPIDQPPTPFGIRADEARPGDVDVLDRERGFFGHTARNVARSFACSERVMVEIVPA